MTRDFDNPRPDGAPPSTRGSGKPGTGSLGISAARPRPSPPVYGYSDRPPSDPGVDLSGGPIWPLFVGIGVVIFLAIAVGVAMNGVCR